MRLNDYPAVEPHWPYGTVAYFYITERDGEKDVGVRELIIREVERTDGGGWLVLADLPAHMLDTKERVYAFEVDSKGESAMCVPWDDDLEEEFNPRIKRFTEKPGTVPVRLTEPEFPTFDAVDDVWLASQSATVEGWWTVTPSAPPAHDVVTEDREAVNHGDHRS